MDAVTRGLGDGQRSANLDMAKDLTKTDRTCPKCGFTFGAVADHCICPGCSHAFDASAHREKPAPNLDLSQLQTCNGLSLPNKYIEYVCENGESRRLHNCREWRLKGIPSLFDNVKVGGAGEQPFHSCVQLFLKLHLEFTGAAFVNSSTGPLEAARVFGGFSFADDNGDYVYLDPFDSFSVWIFHHDGAVVEFVANNFETWLAQSEPAE